MTGARVTAINSRGQTIGVVSSDSQAHYSIRAREARFPLTVSATGGTDLVTGGAPDFTMSAVAVDKVSTINVSPTTTLITKVVKALGAQTAQNVATAKRVVAQNAGFGLDPLLVPDPITTPLADNNSAAVVKAEEAVAEWVRRTRTALMLNGTNSTFDDVANALAADMVDGLLDGKGAAGANVRVASTATVVSAQLHLEVITNRLAVNQGVATDRLDSAIARISTSPLKTEDVPITDAALTETRGLLAAVNTINPNAQLATLYESLKGVKGGVKPAAIRALLPMVDSTIITNAVTSTSLGTTTQQEAVVTVTKAIGSGTSPDQFFPPPATTVPDTVPPTIVLNGANPLTLMAGTSYGEPGASAVDDVDGAVPVTIDNSGVNTSMAGSYQVTYSAVDQALNRAVATRQVVVTAPQPGSFGFSASTYRVAESGGTIEIIIRRSGGSDGTVGVGWKTVDGSATSADYGNFALTTLSFAPGETEKRQTVAIKQDALYEGDESFSVVLSTPTGGATLGTITTATVTITDDDPPPVSGPVVTYPPSTTSLSTAAVPSIARPGYLAPITDPVFKTRVTRITDDTTFGVANARHHYAKDGPWNADGTLIKVRNRLLDGKSYKLVGSFSDPGETRWSHLNPKKMFGVSGTSFVSIDTTTNTRTTLRTFSGVDRCYLGPYEGNISKDDKYVALACQSGVDLTVIVYNIPSNLVETQAKFAGKWADTDWVSMSQSGNYVVIKWNGSLGIDAYDRGMRFLRQLASNGEHGDLCYDTQGNDVYVRVIPVDMTRLDTGARKNLLPGSSGVGGGHISCRNTQRPGWAYVSPHVGVVFAVKLDGSFTVQQFAHHHSLSTPYEAQAQAVPNLLGNQVMFASSWGGSYTANSYVTEMP